MAIASALRRRLRGEAAWLVGGAAYIFLLRLVGAALGYLTHILLARWMGAAELGHYVFAFAWAAVLSQLGALGYPDTTLRFVPQSMAVGDMAAARGFVGYSRKTVLAGSLVVAVVATAVTVIIGRLAPLAGATTLLIAFASVPFLAAITIGGNTARALSLISLSFTPLLLILPVLLLLSVSTMVLTGYELSAPRVIVVFVAIVVAIAVGQHVLLRRHLRRRLGEAKSVQDSRRWRQVALTLLFIGLFTSFFPQLSVITAGLFLASDDLAVYNAAIQTANLIGFGQASVALLVLPKVSGLYGAGDANGLRRLSARAAQLRFWPTILAVLLLVLVGKPFLALFGERFLDGYGALIILASGHAVSGVFGLSMQLLTIAGHERRCLPALACSFAVMAALNALLIPAYGIEGAAVAVLLTRLMWSAWLFRLVTRHMSLDPSILGIRHVFR